MFGVLRFVLPWHAQVPPTLIVGKNDDDVRFSGRIDSSPEACPRRTQTTATNRQGGPAAPLRSDAGQFQDIVRFVMR